MKICVGSDEKTRMTDVLLEELEERGYEVIPKGHLVKDKITWPHVAKQVAEMVAQGEADEGILCCWTGTGVSIAANKVPGIRAALCDDAETARGARLWNDANILCLSIRRTSEIMLREILEAWFNNSYQPNPVDDACLLGLQAIEHTYMK
jgi:ribose 5-phosphate isomerase B